MKYLDLIGYPIAIACTYVLVGFANWDRDPGTWQLADRCIWILWGLAWGWALQCRIRKELV